MEKKEKIKNKSRDKKKEERKEKKEKKRKILPIVALKGTDKKVKWKSQKEAKKPSPSVIIPFRIDGSPKAKCEMKKRERDLQESDVKSQKIQQI